MAQLENRNGFVAFLDILGYANILENNSPEYVANTIFNTLSNAREKTVEILPKITSFKAVHNFNYDLIGIISFSDSILISIDLRSIPEKELTNSLFVYLLYCSFICRLMHESGLPIRGAISYGDYIMVDNFIAGLPIIESYKLGNSLEMEGVVLTASAADKAEELVKGTEFSLNHMMHDYLVELKSGQEKKMFVLSPSPCTIPIIGDIRQFVMRAFWKHHKDISNSVRRKIDNTEQFLRYLKIVHDHLFLDTKPIKKEKQQSQKKPPETSPEASPSAPTKRNARKPRSKA